MEQVVDTKKDHQIELERLFSKNQLMQRIRAEFEGCKEVNFRAYAESKAIPGDFVIELLAQMALHKRADLPTMIGCLRYLTKTSQECADLLLQCAMADLLDWSPALRIFIVKFTISADVQAELDRFQYPLPMVVEPKEVKHNAMSGYLLTGGSIILKHNHHDDDVCLDHVNRMNRVKFTINLDTATMIKNQWRNLDKPKEGESREEFDRRVRAFDKYDRTARDVISTLLAEGNEFYFTHKYDKRGRTYCQGHHANYQGTPWNKAVIEFVDAEVVQ
ncbi:hypothetical protein [Paraburkholderia sp. SIMBA_054]|uniref:hypothetical protein n=1 Tax=Paraburkholderia sp. SIMBA_054 TaxID=3085795 RepID=UPI00397DE584